MALCHSYLAIVQHLLTAEPCVKHCDAIAANPALQQAIVGTLLEQCLPAVAAAVQAEMAAAGQPSSCSMALLVALPLMLIKPSLEAGMVDASEALPAAVKHTAMVVRALPVERPSGMAAAVFSTLQTNAAALLAVCAAVALEQPINPEPSLEAEAADGTTQARAPSQAEHGQAAELVVELLPRLMATVAAMQEDLQVAPAALPADMGTFLPNLDSICTHFSIMLQQLMHALPYLATERQSPHQLSAWFPAATACVRLLPCLPPLHLKQHNSNCCSVEQLSTMLLAFVFWHATCPELHASACSAPLPADDVSAWGDLAVQAWELHTALCRLAAALAAPTAPLRLPCEGLSASSWLSLLHSLNVQLLDMAKVHQLILGAQAPNRVHFAEQALG